MSVTQGVQPEKSTKSWNRIFLDSIWSSTREEIFLLFFEFAKLSGQTKIKGIGNGLSRSVRLVFSPVVFNQNLQNLNNKMSFSMVVLLIPHRTKQDFQGSHHAKWLRPCLLCQWDPVLPRLSYCLPHPHMESTNTPHRHMETL